VLLFVLVLLSDAALTATGGSGRGRLVRFQVTGKGSRVEVTLTAPSWRVARASVAVPLRLVSGEPVTVRVPPGSDVSLSASSLEEDAGIRCEIDVDGAAIDVHESSRAQPDVVCEAHIATP
jgi:hypothetical protein